MMSLKKTSDSSWPSILLIVRLLGIDWIWKYGIEKSMPRAAKESDVSTFSKVADGAERDDVQHHST